MAAKILLTPDELKAQAAEMDALRAEYESLFANVSGELRKANGNWSTNMAGNFAGKINSATKSFRNINDLLENGANAANSCAVSFASVDSELSKLCLGETSFAKSMKKALASDSFDAEETIYGIKKAMDYIDETYENLSESEKKILKNRVKYLLSLVKLDDAIDIYEIIDLILEKDYYSAVWKTIDAGTEVISDNVFSPTSFVVKSLCNFALQPKQEDHFSNEVIPKYTGQLFYDLYKGNFGGAIADLDGFTKSMERCLFDATLKAASDTIDSVFAKNLYGVTLSEYNAIMYDKYGWSPGHAFNDLKDFIGNRIENELDNKRDILTEVNDTVVETVGELVGNTTSFISQGIDNIGSAINKIL